MTDKENRGGLYLGDQDAMVCSTPCVVPSSAHVASMNSAHMNELNAVFADTCGKMNDLVLTPLDFQVKQIEYDIKNNEYLSLVLLNELMEREERESEDQFTTSFYESQLAEQVLQIQLNQAKNEIASLDNTLHINQFIWKFNEWMKANKDKLNTMSRDYKDLAKRCGEVKDYLMLKGIRVPQGECMESALDTELKQACKILDEVGNLDITSLTTHRESIDHRLIQKLYDQFLKLKDLTANYNGLALLTQ